MNGSEILEIILLCQNEDHSIVTVATTRMNLMQKEYLLVKKTAVMKKFLKIKGKKFVRQTE